MQVAQGEADLAGLFYSKSVYPYTVKGAPVGMCFPREGTFASIKCLTRVKNAPEPEHSIAFINWMLDPGVLQRLAEANLAALTITGLEFMPDVAKYRLSRFCQPSLRATKRTANPSSPFSRTRWRR
jgi:putative spermidine/putrescine transport system substrate-binding protein